MCPSAREVGVGVSYVARALDPCKPLGVLECAKWVFSERCRDDACVVMLVSYSAVCLVGACRRVVWPPKARGAPSPEQFWPAPPDYNTYCIRRTRTPRGI